MKNIKNRGEVIMYEAKNGQVSLDVRLEDETVWLNQEQMSKLFERDQSVISRHISNVFKEGELEKKSNMHFLHIPNSDKPVAFYNLDVIISVGYRVKSLRGTQFRIWSNSVLKDYLIKGYSLNQKRLQEKGLDEFESAVRLIKNAIEKKRLTGDEAKGLLQIVTDYSESWLLLQKYDENQLEIPKTKKAKFILEYQAALREITILKENLVDKKEASALFGQERDEALAGIIGNLYQTFDGEELYPGLTEKAAHLLYFVIKDHPFSDGNKRIGSFLFIAFLAQNNYLYTKKGERKFNDNALVALALLVAESDPKQKSTMIKLIMNFISYE